MSSRRRPVAREQGWFDLGRSGGKRQGPPRRVIRAAEVTLRQLRAAGMLDRTDAALVAAYRDLARIAEEASIAPSESTYNAVFAFRAFLEAHERLTRNMAPAAGELEAFLAGLAQPVTDDTVN